MKIGELRFPITVQYLTESVDSTTGRVTKTWATFASVWAGFMPTTYREFIGSDVKRAEIAGKFTIRYLAGVKPSMRIVKDGRTFNIEAVLDDFKSGRQYLLLPVTEIQNG